MKINSLKGYILGNSIGKKEYLFIKEFCLENEIEIIDFFKQGDKYNISAIYAFFIQSFSKSINDEKMIKYFLGKEKYLNNINFKSILENYDVLTTYQHLLGLNKDEELDLFIKEYKTEKILKFLKENPEYKESIKIKSLILNDVVSIEKFEKSEIFFNKDSYNEIDISPDRILGQKEKNINFIKVDKFYDFILKNKSKISTKKRKDYLEAIMSYGSYTTFDFTKDSLWDYSFIPIIHENEFPELVKNKDFFSDLTKYKEQILNLKVPYNSSKIIKSLSPEEKKELLINFIRNYKVESYNSTAHCIFNNFINEINDNFIKDFFKVGIESGFILTYQLKDEYSLPYNKENKYKEINESSKSLDNDVVRKHHEVIAKELLRKKYKYKTGTIDKFVKINKDIIDNKEFIFSLDDEEYSGLIEELKEKNLNKTATVVMTIRLEHKLAHKNLKEKKHKI